LLPPRGICIVIDLMRRARWCRTLILAGLFAAALALPAAAAPAIHLVAPAGGELLPAGSLAELAWEPAAPFDRLDRIEEWEAFLSLDGGAHYTMRITPHLDRGLRRVLWRVPATPTRDARLLLRFGDEHRETVFELPQRFAITGSPVPRFDLAPARVAFTRGEPALPGAAGVVAWVEGGRRGGSARPVVAAEPPSARPHPSLAAGASETAAAETAGGPELDPAAGAALSGQIPALPRRATLLPEQTGPAAPIPILLQSRRKNE
jgi:hypothetical protein